MVGSSDSQGSQGLWGNISSTEMRSIFAEHKDSLTQYFKEELFGYIYQALLMCEIVDPYTSRSVRV